MTKITSRFPRLTSIDAFVQSNLDIGYLRADMEEVKREWLKRTRHLKLEFREPIRKERTWKVI